MSEFDHAIAVTPVGAGVYQAQIDEGWRIGHGVNGGLLAALVGNAIRSELADANQPDPYVVSVAYLGVPHTGPARIEVKTLRQGKSVSVVHAQLIQDDGEGSEPTPRLAMQAVFGNLAALPDQVETSATPPQLTPYEQCIPTAAAPPAALRDAELLNRLNLRVDPTTAGWVIGQPSGVGAIQGWMGFADGREADALALLFFCDALPPVTFDLGRPGWAPTLELTIHVRALPAPGPLRVRHATRNVAHGMFEEDCEIWDSEDRLVAQSRQLARVPRPR